MRRSVLHGKNHHVAILNFLLSKSERLMTAKVYFSTSERVEDGPPPAVVKKYITQKNNF